MLVFTAAELQRNASELQRSAIKGPVLITHHDAPRFILMSVEDYLKMGGDPVVADQPMRASAIKSAARKT